MVERDREYAICPHCGEGHGDCFEWLTSETPQDVECSGCGITFTAWAEHDVHYITEAKGQTMNRPEILDEAKQAVVTDRAATHGNLEDNFQAIAAVWSARLGVEITPAQVGIMMVDLKMTRAWGNPGHADSWVDAAGYAACGGELATKVSTDESLFDFLRE